MAKKKIKRARSYPNIYDSGGLLGKFTSWNDSATSKFMSSGVGGALGKLGVSSGGLGGLVNGVASTVSGLINPSGNSTGVGNAMQTIGSMASNIPGVGGLIGAGVNLAGGLVNAAFGSNLNEDFIKQTENNIANQSGYTSNARSNTALLSDWASHTDLSHVDQDDVGSDGWFSDKAKDKTGDLNNATDLANLRAWMSLSNTASNIDRNNMSTLLSNYHADGGPITMRYTGVMSPFGNMFDDGGGIHIKPENRGKFTALKKRTGKSASWFKAHGTPAQRKMATFALNAAKWKHGDGGPLLTHGGVWSNGVTNINEGGTHEENPFEGVQMGVDDQGIPNLVEQGELVYNDYVFSKRIKAPKALKSTYKLRGDTFADIAKYAQKESEERPNDPISKRGLDDIMTKLSTAQEVIKSMKNRKKRGNKYDIGGNFNKSYYYIPGISPHIPGVSGYDNRQSNPTIITNPTTEYTQGVDSNGNWLTPPKNMSRAAAKRAGNNVGDSLEAYNRAPVPNPDYRESNGDSNTTSKSWLRYAPAFMSGTAAFSDIFSKPDYSAADTISSVDIQPTRVNSSPIGEYLSYEPLDRMFYINQLNKSAGATRRAVRDTSGGNRAAALAGILSADYNYGENLGKMARQAEEYNQALREKVAGFNRQTDMFNAQQDLQAQLANSEAMINTNKMRLAQAEEVAKLSQAARDSYNARRSNNLNSFINNLSSIGWEGTQADWIDNLAKRGVFLLNTKGEYTGNISPSNTGTNDKEPSNKQSRGGKLKKRRRNTYA